MVKETIYGQPQRAAEERIEVEVTPESVSAKFDGVTPLEFACLVVVALTIVSVVVGKILRDIRNATTHRLPDLGQHPPPKKRRRP